MEIIKKANRVIYKVCGETISIPSRMYPLESDSFKCFDSDNTSEIVDERIIAIFDSIKPEVGRCFTNAETICVALNKAGYPAKQYVGWLFIKNRAENPIRRSDNISCQAVGWGRMRVRLYRIVSAFFYFRFRFVYFLFGLSGFSIPCSLIYSSNVSMLAPPVVDRK